MTTPNEGNDEERIVYSVKVVSPPAGTSTERLSVKKEFETVAEMKNQLQSNFFPEKEFTFGYIKRGHGRQVQIVNDEDIADMYEEYRGCRKHINLWGKSKLPSRKRPASEAREKRPSEGCSCTKKPKTSGNYQGHLHKMTEVELIVEELEKRHSASESFSVEQLRVWAHMLHLKKHDSYDQPPNKPFFRHSKAAQKLVGADQENRMSPAKRIQLRTELIEQLGKWHSLMECGAISNGQFQEMTETIVTDMKKY